MDVSHIRMPFVYKLKLDLTSAEAARDINKAVGDDIVKERSVPRWYQKL